MKKKIAIVTGSSGQDGSYLCELLIKKSYKVIAADRRSSRDNKWRHKFLKIDDKLIYEDFDLGDLNSIVALFRKYKIDEFYNLAAQSFVAASFKTPLSTSEITGIGVLRVIDCIKNYQPKVKFYQASSSEMYGNSKLKFQDEYTKFNPRSPYAVAKLFGHHITKNYREAYNLFLCSGILFNHESPLRGDEFVTKKIVKHLVEVKKKERSHLELGNLYAKRDWGYAKDYVQAMWLMLQKKIPEDYVIATNKSYSVKFFSDLVLKALKFNYKWVGKGINEKAIDKLTRKPLIKINKKFYRPAEVNFLKGSYKKAKNQLKWRPKTSIKELVKIMVDFELKNSSYKNS